MSACALAGAATACATSSCPIALAQKEEDLEPSLSERNDPSQKARVGTLPRNTLSSAQLSCAGDSASDVLAGSDIGGAAEDEDQGGPLPLTGFGSDLIARHTA